MGPNHCSCRTNGSLIDRAEHRSSLWRHRASVNPDLPIITWPEARARGLVQERDVAACLGLSRAELTQRVDDGEIGAVATMKNPRNGHRYPLFALDDLRGQRAAVAPVTATEDDLDLPYRSRPPRRVGTRTTTANRQYQWRDPARWREPRESA